jgi:hypothetical protein
MSLKRARSFSTNPYCEADIEGEDSLSSHSSLQPFKRQRTTPPILTASRYTTPHGSLSNQGEIEDPEESDSEPQHDLEDMITPDVLSTPQKQLYKNINALLHDLHTQSLNRTPPPDHPISCKNPCCSRELNPSIATGGDEGGIQTGDFQDQTQMINNHYSTPNR